MGLMTERSLSMTARIPQTGSNKDRKLLQFVQTKAKKVPCNFSGKPVSHMDWSKIHDLFAFLLSYCGFKQQKPNLMETAAIFCYLSLFCMSSYFLFVFVISA